MDYVFPEKEILEKSIEEISEEKKYYNLSRLIFKRDFDNKLLIPLGIDKEGEEYYIDFNEKTSMFIAGETGSGKSIYLNDIIVSLLLKNSPEDLQFVFIDQRNIELNLYNGIPLLYKDCVSDADDSIDMLNYVVKSIEKRKELFSKLKVNNIVKYNEKSDKKLPQIILIIDEATDILKLKETEDLINKILPDGYKFGVHIIIATNSYLKDCFSPNTMKLFNYKITFDLASKEQANLIKINDAHLLSVHGEVLVKYDRDELVNLQLPYVSEQDIKNVVNFIKIHTTNFPEYKD